jgi:uncharacterized protein (DUF4415 family)
MKKTDFEMRDEYEFSNAKRDPIIPQKTKQTRITIYIDDDVLDSFRQLANEQQRGYQPMITEALRDYLNKSRITVNEDKEQSVIRRQPNVIRDELQAVA